MGGLPQVGSIFDSTPSRPADYASDLRDEGGREPVDIRIDELNEDAIETWWTDTEHGEFCTFNNCSDIVSEALRKGGADIPDHIINHPDQVKEDVDEFLEDRLEFQKIYRLEKKMGDRLESIEYGNSEPVTIDCTAAIGVCLGTSHDREW